MWERPGATATLLLAAALMGCYWSSAVRHAGPIARSGWDMDRYSAGVVVTGPVTTVWAGLDLAVRSVVPFEAPEPTEKWFRFYTGPMLPLDQVAVLCHMENSTQIQSIRVMDGGARFPARYHKWHFPRCIEALPGVYELEVYYFQRRTDDVHDQTSTHHTESVEPSRVAWYAEAGGIYALRARLGGTHSSSTPAPRSRVSRRSSLGTAHFELEEGDWAAEVERLSSWDAFPFPALAYREAWRRYEGS